MRSPDHAPPHNITATNNAYGAARLIRLWATMRLVLGFLFFALVNASTNIIPLAMLIGLTAIMIYRFNRLPVLIHISRLWGIRALIDPLADRIFLIAATTGMLSAGLLPLWPAYALAFRDVFVALFFLGIICKPNAASIETTQTKGYDVAITLLQYLTLALALFTVSSIIVTGAAVIVFLLSIRSCFSMLRSVKTTHKK